MQIGIQDLPLAQQRPEGNGERVDRVVPPGEIALENLKQRLLADLAEMSSESLDPDETSTGRTIRLVKAEGVRVALSRVDEAIDRWTP